ncbi:acylglycerol kinase, mitochondrial [Chelonus insularis]|uniref:acylglycerol kinase, mitochondrial n=1 Tax=Chelonus insularis TaxID=460826 RepID=UPI00158F5E95|nr:acylglycerol kinase, mitochondrial [Chelonus insularis]XP_034950528.1 acylglycerol kinase, mitochondrial [Chelonus insularis]
MSRIVKIVTTIRNNWKKSLVGVAAVTYGVSYASEKYQTNSLMRAYCQEVVKFGDEPLPTTKHPQHLVVILNPIAKKRKCKKLFQEFCEPLLHLAGIAVTIIYTEQEGHARSLVEKLEIPADAFLVAGGDGTVLDVVTGLIRRYDGNLSNIKNIPIGILPLGELNKLANSIFVDKYDDLNHVRQMIDATMAAIRGSTKLIDVVKVEPLVQDPENLIKPIYATNTIQWGAWRDVEARQSKYWYWGSLKSYVTYIFNGYKKKNINWDCNANIRYSDPCQGCSNCYNKSQFNESSDKRWWHVFIPRIKSYSNEPDYSRIKNENCNKYHEVPITATELSIVTRNVEHSLAENLPAMKLKLGPENISYLDFVKEGWRRNKGYITLVQKTFEAKDLELMPTMSDNSDDQQYFSIDNEEFELKPMKLKLIPNAVKIFCP